MSRRISGLRTLASLFCTFVQLNIFIFNSFRTLDQNTRGVASRTDLRAWGTRKKKTPSAARRESGVSLSRKSAIHPMARFAEVCWYLLGRQNMYQVENYCWTVSCKNRWFHLRHNLRLNHRIPLGITDDFAACPKKDEGLFAARCNECGKEYVYKPSDVRRTKQELPDSFVAHPRFW